MLLDQVKPDEEALRSYYENSKDQYMQAEQRQAQHILLAVAADADDEEVERIRELASDLCISRHVMVKILPKWQRNFQLTLLVQQMAAILDCLKRG